MTEAVRLLVAELGATPLIGFAGAPFTLASYLVEGGPSKDYAQTKALMVGDPDLWDELCDRAGRHRRRLPARSRSTPGPAAVQLFDSWAGSLSAADYAALRAAATPRACSQRGRRPASRASTSASAPASCSG